MRDVLKARSHVPRGIGNFRRWLTMGLAGLVIVFGGTGLAWTHDRLQGSLSPYDEGQHIDYVDRMLDFGMLRQGDLMGQDALKEWACRGAPGLVEPPCGGDAVDPGAYAWGGVNTAHIHPPTYYFVTSFPARLFLMLGAELTTAGRLVGGLWLAGALVLLWVALGMVGVGTVQRGIVLTLVGTTPVVLHASLTVNPDSTSLLAGSLLIVATVGWERRRIASWGLALASALAVALKLTNALAVAASLLYLVLRWVLTGRGGPIDGESHRRPYSVAIVAVMVGAVASASGWLLIHGLLATASTDPQEILFRVDSLRADKILGQTWALVTPIDVQYVPPFLDSPAVLAVATLLQIVLLSSVVAIPLFLRPLGRAATLALSGAAIMVAGGIVLVLANFVLNSQIFVPIPARYGLSLVPFIAAAVGVVLRNRWFLWAGGALAVASVTVGAVGFIGGMSA